MADKYVDKVAMQENITKTKEYVDKKHTQVNSLPIPSIDYLHQVYQYVGTTGNGYTHNYFYECVSDGESTPTYFWQQTSVQPASSLAVEDSEGTTLASRDTMQFGTGFNATDDSENEKTVVEADLMQSGDMDDIVTPLPTVAPKKEGVKYSTTEQVIGEWIDGKPVYQKTISHTIASSDGSTEYENIGATIDLVASLMPIMFNGDSLYVNTNYTEVVSDESKKVKVSVYNNDNNSNPNKIVVQNTSQAWVGAVIYITIQYTKTTT